MEEPLKILIVDDDLVDRMTIRRALTRGNIPMMLREACDGETMMQALESGAWGAVER